MTSYRDWVVETSSTTGTGSYSLSGAAPAGTGYFTFRQRYSNGEDRVVYWVVNSDRTKWEKNQFGTLTYGTPDILSRNVIESTNGDAPVPWVGGDLPLRVYVAPDSDAVESVSNVNIQRFNANGTYTPHTKMISGYVVGKGGGSGAGGAAVVTTVNYGSSGGGEGNTVTKTIVRDDVLPNMAVVIGPGGAGGTGTGSSTAGGDTTFGSILTAKGALAASQYVVGRPNTSGNVGDNIELGAAGGAGMQGPNTVLGFGGTGGGGGGGSGAVIGTPGTFSNGGNANTNSGGGGGGAAAHTAGPGNISGGNGGSGNLYVVEFLRK